MVYQLVYVSAAQDGSVNTTIEDILEKSRENNERTQITGMLMAHDGNFFQVLEGDEAAVAACYARIQQDERHKDPIILMTKHVDTRSFPQWSMGYATPEDLSDEHRDIIISLTGLIDNLEAQFESTSPEISVLAGSFVRSFRDFGLA